MVQHEKVRIVMKLCNSQAHNTSYTLSWKVFLRWSSSQWMCDDQTAQGIPRHLLAWFIVQLSSVIWEATIQELILIVSGEGWLLANTSSCSDAAWWRTSSIILCLCTSYPSSSWTTSEYYRGLLIGALVEVPARIGLPTVSTLNFARLSWDVFCRFMPSPNMFHHVWVQVIQVSV